MKAQAMLLSLSVVASIGVCAGNEVTYSEAQKRELANKAFSVSSALPEVTKDQLKALLLLSPPFEELEKSLTKIENKYDEDISHEIILLRTYDQFCGMGNEANPKLDELIDQWVLQKGTYHAYAARGCYKTGKASKYRGSGYISNVPPEDLAKATNLWKSALDDLDKSLALNKKFIPAYNRLIGISMQMGNRAAANAAMSNALKARPALFYLRSNYLEYLQPKWGATFEEADKFIRDAQKYGPENPRIWSLRGFIPAMIAYQHSLNGEFSLAVSRYSEALQYGDRQLWLRGKAFDQYMLGDYESSIESMAIVENHLRESSKAGVSYVIATLRNEADKKRKYKIPPPAASYKDGSFNGPLGWVDFQ